MASSPQVSCAADNATGCSVCRHMAACHLDFVCGFVGGVLCAVMFEKEGDMMKNRNKLLLSDFLGVALIG